MAETKPGYKTTEFWLSLAAAIVGALLASGVFAPLGEDNWIVRMVGAAAAVLASLGYTSSRTKTKTGG